MELDEIDKTTFVNIVSKDLKYIIPNITAPTMLYWGKYDTETKLKIAKLLHKNIPNSVLYVVEGGHFEYLYQQEHFSYCVKNFLGGNNGL